MTPVRPPPSLAGARRLAPTLAPTSPHREPRTPGDPRFPPNHTLRRAACVPSTTMCERPHEDTPRDALSAENRGPRTVSSSLSARRDPSMSSDVRGVSRPRARRIRASSSARDLPQRDPRAKGPAHLCGPARKGSANADTIARRSAGRSTSTRASRTRVKQSARSRPRKPACVERGVARHHLRELGCRHQLRGDPRPRSIVTAKHQGARAHGNTRSRRTSSANRPVRSRGGSRHVRVPRRGRRHTHMRTRPSVALSRSTITPRPRPRVETDMFHVKHRMQVGAITTRGVPTQRERRIQLSRTSPFPRLLRSGFPSRTPAGERRARHLVGIHCGENA